MILQTLFLIFCIRLSASYPSTERSVIDDSYSDDSYQEIFPIPLLDYLKENKFTNLPVDQSNDPNDNQSNNPFNLFNNNNNPDQFTNQSTNRSNKVALHVLPTSTELDERSFVIVHRPNQNQYLDLGRVNTGNEEKRFILTELRQPIRPTNRINPFSPLSSISDVPNDLTLISIQHQSNRNTLNLNLSFSQAITSTTVLPKPNTTAIGSNLTSLNVAVSSGKNTTVSLNLVSSNATSSCHNATVNSTTSAKFVSELVSTNIEKPKELAKNLSKKTDATRSTNQQQPDEIDVNRTLLTSDELDNNSTTLNNASYSSLGDDVLNVNDLSSFNKINPSSLDLVLDALNDTTTTADDISLNSTVSRSG